MHQINTLYTINLHNVKSHLYPNKVGGKKQENVYCLYSDISLGTIKLSFVLNY